MQKNQRQRGRPTVVPGEKAEEKMNLKLPLSAMEDLYELAGGDSTKRTAVIRNLIEKEMNRPPLPGETSMESAIDKCLVGILETYFGRGVPLLLEEDSREQLERVSKEMGFLMPAHFLRALTQEALKDPAAAEALLFGKTRERVKARAQKEMNQEVCAD